MARAADAATVRVDGRELRLTDLTTAVYPDGFTKAEVVDYYTRAAPVLLPHLARRPVTLIRRPGGPGGPVADEPGCPDDRPGWLATVEVPTPAGTVTTCTLDDRASLVWAAQAGAVELRALPAAAPDLGHPRELVLDLEPGPPVGLAGTAAVALLLRDALRGVGLEPRLTSSGATGLHVRVALDGRTTFAETRRLARTVAEAAERAWPDRITTAPAARRRADRVLVDWRGNDRHRATVVPYSLRAGGDGPTVAAPLRWEEVEEGVVDEALLRLSPAETLARIDRYGDLHATPPGALATYRSMRDFTATPEPAGGSAAAAPAGGTDAREEQAGAAPLRFVVQQHDATRLHWDLRLERDGVLASWALPRCLPWTPDENHLAVHTEDHPLEYLDFEGHIPEGNYGAGEMTVWDRGSYEPVEMGPRKVVVDLHGTRARGRYALFATGRSGGDRPDGGRDWMIHRMDPPEDPGRRPVPTGWRPMRATPGPVPDGDDVAFEPCWTGLRVLVVNTPGMTNLVDGEGRDVSAGFPEVRRLSRALGAVEVVLDGVVVEHRDGRPLDRPVALHRRRGGPSDSVVRRLARDHPVLFVAFDLLWRDGHPRLERPWEQRREELDGLGLDGPAWQAPHPLLGGGADLLAAVAERGGRGVVGKRRSSVYRPGTRSPDWVVTTVAGAGGGSS